MCVTVLRRKSHGHTTGWQLLYYVRTAFVRSKRNLEKCGAIPEGKDYLSCSLSDKRTWNQPIERISTAAAKPTSVEPRRPSTKQYAVVCINSSRAEYLQGLA